MMLVRFACEKGELAMPGLRDRVQHPHLLASSDVGEMPEEIVYPLDTGGRSAAQRVLHVGFSVQGSEQPSAWKRRFGTQATMPTETTLRTLVLTRCSLIHSIGGLLFAGGATVFYLESGMREWLWLILLSMLVVAYAVAAYWFAEHHDGFGTSRFFLVGGDLLATGCFGLLLGFSPVVALLVPGIVLLAAILANRREALLAAFAGSLVVIGLALFDLAGVAHLHLYLRPLVTTVFTLLGTLLCLGWMTGALMMLLRDSERLPADVTFNSAEVARARIESDVHARQVQDGLALLQQTLARAEAGDLRARAALKEGELAQLAARINGLLERQEQMFAESQRHRRLERAVGELLALLEALHRGEYVGWPVPTGTQVDRILALMRAPSRPLTTRKLAHAEQEEAPSPSQVPGQSAAAQRLKREGTSSGLPPRRIPGHQ
jgi:hypothetical protein